MFDNVASRSTARGKIFADAMSDIGRVEVSVVCLAAAIIVAVNIVLAANGVPIYPIFRGLINTQFLTSTMLVVLGAELARLFYLHRPESPLRFIVYSEAAKPTFIRIIPTAIMVFCVGFFMPVFSQMKSAIPLLTEYTWDATFIGWDQAIHGDDPWRILQPVLGYPIVTAALGHLYHLWFGLIYVGPPCFALYVLDKELRLRFFFGYFLTWSIVGMIGAVSLASVGPVFLEPLLGDDHFAEQMAYIHAANAVYAVPVVEIQQMLLTWYESGDFGLGRGITAMPSMHVALTTLYVFATWRIDKRLWAAFVVYWVLIMLGSIHLAYHYAVDGYVALVMVALIWLATKPMAKFVLRGGQKPAAEAVS